MDTLGTRELPLTLDLAKQHLRLGDAAHDDALVRAKMEMAVAAAEDMTGRLIRARTVGFHVLCPTGDTILLPLPVHTSGVRELSVSGVLIPREKYTLLADDYEPMLHVDGEYEGQRLYVKAVVGYNVNTVPPAIKAAILLILGTLYDNESDNVVGRSVSELSLTAEKLLAPWRVTPYGNV
jgi:hypothetical protein